MSDTALDIVRELASRNPWRVFEGQTLECRFCGSYASKNEVLFSADPKGHTRDCLWIRALGLRSARNPGVALRSGARHSEARHSMGGGGTDNG